MLEKWGLTWIVLLLVSEISLLSTTFASASFRSTKAPSEIINNYEIVTPVTTKTTLRTKEYPRRLTVSIVDPKSTHKFVLHLKLNEKLFPPHLTIRYYDERDNEIVEKGHENCFYQGWVEGYTDWRATMSTCHGLRGSFGDLHNESQHYHIEPLDGHLTALDQPHALYLATEFHNKKKGSCGSKHDSSEVLDIQIPTDRLKRQTANGLLIVEWALVNDMAQYRRFDMNRTAVVMRNLEMTNFVDAVYQTLNVRVVLVDVTIWTNGDRIMVSSSPDDLLDNFEAYKPQITAAHDSAMLITGVDLNGDVVGIAFVQTMCNDRSSVGVTQDGSRSNLEAVGSTAAHELGHILNRAHDDEGGRMCSCMDPSSVCIMAGTAGFPPPVEWSDCSRSDIQVGFTRFNLDRCLKNEPTVTIGDPVCGNGIRERDEMCDCGSIEECLDPCCNATTCMLAEGAQCFTGDCCDRNCQFVPYGTTCREATQECDILECCTGESSECPADLHLQDGHDCNNNRSYCFSGMCVTYDSQCEFHFGSGSRAGVDRCFSAFNVRGNTAGNCGSSGGQYVACASEDALCGQLHCDAVPSQFMNNANRAVTIISNGIGGNRCVSFTSSAGDDTPSPGLVADGSKCGNEKICFIQSCIQVSDLPGLQACPVGTNGLTCSGNGVCNNLNQCFCEFGFDGIACQPPVVTQPPMGPTMGTFIGPTTGTFIGPTTKRPTTNESNTEPVSRVNGGAIAGGVIGGLLAIIVLIAGIAGLVVLMFKHKRKNVNMYSNPAYKQTSIKSASSPASTSVAVKSGYNGYSSTNIPVQNSIKPPPQFAAVNPRPVANPPSQPVPTIPPSRPVPTIPPSRPVPTNPPSRPVPTNPPSRPVPTNPPSRPVPVNPPSRPVPANPPSRPVPTNPPSRPVPANPPSRPVPTNPPSRPVPANPPSRPVPVNPPSKPVPANPPSRPVPINLPTIPGPPQQTTPSIKIARTRPAPPPRPAPNYPPPRPAPVSVQSTTPRPPPPPPSKSSKPNVPKPPPQSSKTLEANKSKSLPPVPPSKPLLPSQTNTDTGVNQLPPQPRERNMKPIVPKKPTVLPRFGQ